MQSVLSDTQAGRGLRVSEWKDLVPGTTGWYAYHRERTNKMRGLNLQERDLPSEGDGNSGVASEEIKGNNMGVSERASPTHGRDDDS